MNQHHNSKKEREFKRMSKAEDFFKKKIREANDKTEESRIRELMRKPMTFEEKVYCF